MWWKIWSHITGQLFIHLFYQPPYLNQECYQEKAWTYSQTFQKPSTMNLVTISNLFSLFKYQLPHLHHEDSLTNLIDLLWAFIATPKALLLVPGTEQAGQSQVLCHVSIVFIAMIIIFIVSILVASSQLRTNPLIWKNSTNAQGPWPMHKGDPPA